MGYTMCWYIYLGEGILACSWPMNPLKTFLKWQEPGSSRGTFWSSHFPQPPYPSSDPWDQWAVLLALQPTPVAKSFPAKGNSEISTSLSVVVVLDRLLGTTLAVCLPHSLRFLSKCKILGPEKVKFQAPHQYSQNTTKVYASSPCLYMLVNSCSSSGVQSLSFLTILSMYPCRLHWDWPLVIRQGRRAWEEHVFLMRRGHCSIL